VAFSGRVVVVSAVLLVPAAVLVVLLGTISWPVAVAIVALGALFVVFTAPLWQEVTPRRARRGFLFSGPYLLGIVVALAVNAPLLHVGVGPRL
jgi:heme O synthase-like polyprenyltransferase